MRRSKTASFFVLLAFLFSLHLCACEDALAAVEAQTHAHEACGRHESSNGRSHDADPDDKSSCCAKIVAVPNSTQLFDALWGKAFSIGHAKVPAHGASIAPDFILVPRQKFELPPGASPPEVFLTSHFAHAPPLAF